MCIVSCVKGPYAFGMYTVLRAQPVNPNLTQRLRIHSSQRCGFCRGIVLIFPQWMTKSHALGRRCL